MATTLTKIDLEAEIKKLQEENAKLAEENDNLKAAEVAVEDANKEAEDYLNEEVEIRLFKGAGKYKDDIFVCVDGKSYQIQRGKTVKVPRKIALVVLGSEEAKAQNDERFDAQEEAFNAKHKDN